MTSDLYVGCTGMGEGRKFVGGVGRVCGTAQGRAGRGFGGGWAGCFPFWEGSDGRVILGGSGCCGGKQKPHRGGGAFDCAMRRIQLSMASHWPPGKCPIHVPDGGWDLMLRSGRNRVGLSFSRTGANLQALFGSLYVSGCLTYLQLECRFGIAMESTGYGSLEWSGIQNIVGIWDSIFTKP